MHNKWQLKQQVEELEAFLQTELHKNFQFTHKRDLEAVKEQIVATNPTMETLPLLNMLHGQKETLGLTISFFEDALVSLKEQLIRAEDGETQPKTYDEKL